MARLDVISWVALVLLIIGGVNWGLIGLFNVDLVAAIFGTMTFLSRLIYIIVGVSAVYVAVMAPKLAKK
jgi:uncharacterized membrane protein YuzA (DUF378 family)